MPLTVGLVAIPLITLALGTVALLLAVPSVARRVIGAMLSQPMAQTLAELYVSSKSTTPMKMLYLSQRAAVGGPVIRPMGSAHPVHGLDDLAFNPAQLARHPLDAGAPVDLRVTLGPRAARPLRLDLPIFVSGMAYGLAITRNARLALAKGTAMAGVALDSGQGPFLEEERRLCRSYILQYGRWAWNREPDVIRQADMLEVQVGQGAMPGNAVVGSPDHVGPEVRLLLGIAPDEPPVIHARLFLESPDRPSTLAAVVAHLRGLHPEVPIAVKMGAGDDIEADLDAVMAAGADVAVIDGTEGATGNAPVTLSDHFGIPTFPALVRAVRHLERRGARDRLQIVVSGGLREPGDFLKAIALGADCVAIGTAAMFAIAHPQITRTVPFYPPTDLVFYRSRPQIPLDVDAGAQALANYLLSCRTEMELALRTMGRRSLAELGPGDLVALDRDVAATARVRFAGEPREPSPGGPDEPRSADGRSGVRHATERRAEARQSVDGRLEPSEAGKGTANGRTAAQEGVGDGQSGRAPSNAGASRSGAI